MQKLPRHRNPAVFRVRGHALGLLAMVFLALSVVDRSMLLLASLSLIVALHQYVRSARPVRCPSCNGPLRTTRAPDERGVLLEAYVCLTEGIFWTSGSSFLGEDAPDEGD